MHPDQAHYIVEEYVSMRQRDREKAEEQNEASMMTARQLLSILRLSQVRCCLCSAVVSGFFRITSRVACAGQFTRCAVTVDLPRPTQTSTRRWHGCTLVHKSQSKTSTKLSAWSTRAFAAKSQHKCLFCVLSLFSRFSCGCCASNLDSIRPWLGVKLN